MIAPSYEGLRIVAKDSDNLFRALDGFNRSAIASFATAPDFDNPAPELLYSFSVIEAIRADKVDVFG